MNLIEIEFSIWLASKTKWVHLTKNISLASVPRVGEFIKLNNNTVGDYFTWEVKDVTYQENGIIQVSTELLNNIDERMYSFEDDAEFIEYFNSYLKAGWQSLHGVKVNRHFIKD